jgi:hypothetical protein
MNHADKICKEVLNLVTFSNDQLQRLLVNENTNRTISLSEKDLQIVLLLVKTSLDNSYQSVFTSLHNKINEEIDLASSKKTTKK